MPVYQVITHEGLLTDDLRQQLAGEITTIHTSHTGAPELFVNVVFVEARDGRTFTAGEPSKLSVVAGQIREGREIETRQAMLRDLSEMWVRVTGQSDREVLLAIGENDPRAAMELGLIMPAAGEEAAWFEQHKDKLASLGLTA